MTAWFIDALDGLSGQAFASHRQSGQLATLSDLSGPAWYVSAPDFAPEPISGRTIGLAATQRGFQLGLSTDGETEVPFTSLEALVDYVRRLYLSGGGGDGPAGIDPAPGGPDGPDDPDRPAGDIPPPDTASPLQSSLLDFAHTLLFQSGNLSGSDTSAELTPLAPTHPASDTSNEAEPLFQAAKLISEALERLALDTPPNVPNRFHAIYPAYQAFYAVLDLLNLPDLPDLDARNAGRMYLLRLRNRPSPKFIHLDILDTLSRLPVPAFVCISHYETERWRSVKDVFFAVLGNPAHLKKTYYHMERSALFLFAAAAIAQREIQPSHSDPNHGSLMENVFNWLRPQMPKFAFNKDLEATLEAIGRN